MLPYDITKTFEENSIYGPHWDEELLDPPKRKATHVFLGKKINSPFGLAASPLTFTARSIKLFSRLGYDLITYRSVRSVEWHGLKAPNWGYVDAKHQLELSDLKNPLIVQANAFANQAPTTANSFGVQSLKPEYWQAEYELAKSYMLPGQLLILAMMLTPERGISIVEDAKDIAHLAIKTSAEVFEINLACPNSGSKALVYEDLQTSIRICSEIKQIVGNKFLLAKIGYYEDQKKLRQFMKNTRGIINGITTTNTYSAPVHNNNDEDFFVGRQTAGISGEAIRTLSQKQAKSAVLYKKQLNLKNFVIVGVGGVMQPKHITEYLTIGATAVQSVTGVWADPYLAMKYHWVYGH